MADFEASRSHKSMLKFSSPESVVNITRYHNHIDIAISRNEETPK